MISVAVTFLPYRSLFASSSGPSVDPVHVHCGIAWVHATFNFHPHLPHYALTTDDTKSVHEPTRQPIDLDRPHHFTQTGNTEFNSFIRMPPNAQRAGHILLADSTIFTTLFGGVESFGSSGLRARLGPFRH
jgi:hypothetical protein